MSCSLTVDAGVDAAACICWTCKQCALARRGRLLAQLHMQQLQHHACFEGWLRLLRQQDSATSACVGGRHWQHHCQQQCMLVCWWVGERCWFRGLQACTVWAACPGCMQDSPQPGAPAGGLRGGGGVEGARQVTHTPRGGAQAQGHVPLGGHPGQGCCDPPPGLLLARRHGRLSCSSATLGRPVRQGAPVRAGGLQVGPHPRAGQRAAAVVELVAGVADGPPPRVLVVRGLPCTCLSGPGGSALQVVDRAWCAWVCLC